MGLRKRETENRGILVMVEVWARQIICTWFLKTHFRINSPQSDRDIAHSVTIKCHYDSFIIIMISGYCAKIGSK